MRRYLSWVAAGLLGLAVGLVVYMPAHVAIGWADAALPAVRIAGVGGTLLDGHAETLRYQDVTVQQVRWELHPLALLTGSLAATITIATDSGQLRGWTALSWSGNLTLEQVTGGATLAWFARHAGYSFVPVGGGLELDLAHLTLTRAGEIGSLSGNVRARGVHWQLLTPPPLLGDYTVTLRSTDTASVAEITGNEGPLALEGKASMGAQGVYDLDLRLRTRPRADPRLEKLLTTLGRPDAGGWYHIRERGRMR